MHPNVYALGAIGLWASLASLGLLLTHLPPFLLTGLALVIGSVPAWPLVRHWKVPPGTLALGIYGLFGYHFLLFIALRHAPAVEANLVNYLWPLFIVLFAPAFLPSLRLRPRHVLAALLGFAGAAIAILGAAGGDLRAGWSWGYLPALGAAFVWATYSLGTRRVRGLSDRGHRPVRPGLRPARACVPLAARTRGRVGAPRRGAAHRHGTGAPGRGLLPLGQGAQGRRSTTDRRPELHHAARVDLAAAAGERSRADVERGRWPPR